MIEEILGFNREFVREKKYEEFVTDKFPKKRIAIVTCMDTRLVALLPAALGLDPGDVKMIKNAGGVITDTFDSAMRSLLVAVYELGVNEIMVIGHTDCGVEGMKCEELYEIMKERGIDEHRIELIKRCGIDLDGWLTGFDSCGKAIEDTVELIRNHPLMASDVKVGGFVIDSVTGELTPLNI